MRRQIVSLLPFLTLASTAFAQTATPTSSPQVTGQATAADSQIILNEVNTSRFPLIEIFATVLKDGKPQKGLRAGDFRVREDEVDQGPLNVEAKLPPLSVVIALDNSGSMKPRMKETKAAAKELLNYLDSNDSAEVIGFAQQVKILSTMSANRDAAKKAIDSTSARGNTALYDALYASIDAVKGRPGRKAVVLLSDGVDDNGVGKQLSKHSIDEVIGYARQVNVPLYAIGIGTEVDSALLANIAQSTGALSFLTPKPEELKSLYDRIGEQLAGQYLITYNSNLPGDGSPHQVQVKYGELASSKEYQSPQLVESSSTSSTITAATPAPKTTATPEKPKKESTTVTLGGVQNILESAGITVKKDGKEFSVGTDGISIKDSNSSPSPASSANPSENQKPDWIPIPDGGLITSQTVIGDDTGRIALTIRRPETEIRNFYRGQFTQKGWNITELQHGGSGTLIATGDGKRVQIAVTEQSSGDTLVAINYNAD
jgi:VWFA-related protein